MSILSEPKWKSDVRQYGSKPEPHIRNWLLDKQSLTKRLIAKSNASFRVRVDCQQWACPLRNEARMLDIPERSVALVRAVHLLVDETPVVYARTVIPKSVLTGKYAGLGGLGSRPLGAVLFANPAMKREKSAYAQISRGQNLYDEAMQHSTNLGESFWGRCSLFWLKKERLLVSEFFLPTINELNR